MPRAQPAHLRGLQNEGIEPVPLLWAITRELRILTKASEQVSQGATVTRH